jgi:hypothetical protein
VNQLFRVDPHLPASAYQTYIVAAPVQTHTRVAQCSEVDCQSQARGWAMLIDESTELGQRQAYYLRYVAGRAYREEREATGLTRFTFPAGQRCFAEHRVSNDRPELYLIKGGDWRGNPLELPLYRHDSAENWVDDFATHQDNIATIRQRG